MTYFVNSKFGVKSKLSVIYSLYLQLTAFTADMIIVLKRKQLSSKHWLVFKTCSRHVLKTSSTRLQRNNFHLPRRLEDVLKTSWKTKSCYTEDVLQVSLRYVLTTSWTRLGDRQNVNWEYMYLTNLNVYLTTMFCKSNPKCIN